MSGPRTIDERAVNKRDLSVELYHEGLKASGRDRAITHPDDVMKLFANAVYQMTHFIDKSQWTESDYVRLAECFKSSVIVFLQSIHENKFKRAEEWLGHAAMFHAENLATSRSRSLLTLPYYYSLCEMYLTFVVQYVMHNNHEGISYGRAIELRKYIKNVAAIVHGIKEQNKNPDAPLLRKIAQIYFDMSRAYHLLNDQDISLMYAMDALTTLSSISRDVNSVRDYLVMAEYFKVLAVKCESDQILRDLFELAHDYFAGYAVTIDDLQAVTHMVETAPDCNSQLTEVVIKVIKMIIASRDDKHLQPSLLKGQLKNEVLHDKAQAMLTALSKIGAEHPSEFDKEVEDIKALFLAELQKPEPEMTPKITVSATASVTGVTAAAKTSAPTTQTRPLPAPPPAIAVVPRKPLLKLKTPVPARSVPAAPVPARPVPAAPARVSGQNIFLEMDQATKQVADIAAGFEKLCEENMSPSTSLKK